MTKRRSPAPDHLAIATQRWWKTVVAEYELENHHLRLLQLAAEAWDRAQDARTAILAHGTTYNDRFGAPRMRPEVVIERDCRLAFARLIRELDLDVDPPASTRTAPAPLRSNRRAT